jgi:hypothetical protein
MTAIPGNQTLNAFCVAVQPSVLTVWGVYPGWTSRASAAQSP